MNSSQCPCGLQANYSDCCGRFIEEGEFPETAEQLMRSRYAAYSQANIDYIAQTMRGPALNDFNPEQAKAWAEQVEWLGLAVTDHQEQGDHATVSFIARFFAGGQRQNMIEKSEFQKTEGRWYYVDGEQPSPGRNDACPCGSGKKYKKCCML
jgi:SEC-C motif domain protein